MTPRSLKCVFAGLAFVATAAPSIAMADPTCVYVIGHVNTHTVTTPSLLVVVPDSDAAVQPVAVHVDDTTQTILGYSTRAPGASGDSYGQGVFVPGVSQNIPSFSVTVPQINLTPSRCVNVNGVSTPAVPVYIPASVLTLPGATGDVGGILLNIVGNPVTAAGAFVKYNGNTIVIPNQNTGVPGVPVGTPNQSLVVNIDGVLETARYMTPN